MTDARTQRLRRARPVVALAAVAFAVGAIVGAGDRSSPALALADRFATAWAHGDYSAMYSSLDAPSRRATSASAFAAAYRDAITTATVATAHVAGHARRADAGVVLVPVRVQTRLFGTLSLDFELKVIEGGEGARIEWSRSQAFPGLRAGEQLSRRTTMPRRATLLARDGSVLAEGAAGESATPIGEQSRDSPLGSSSSSVLGTVGTVPAARRAALEADGVPAQAIVGLSGLERALDDLLRGKPGGALLAVQERSSSPGRVLAYVNPQPASAVRSSVSPGLQRAAVTALGGQLGGIIALQPSSGQILADAGIGLDGLQPPGSTFKLITLAGVLEAGLANPRTTFPYATYATLDGVKLSNANGENCGGSLELAFAVSCNSVFAPLGAKLGSTRLVAMAERFGFNQPTGIAGAPASTLPAPARIQGELDTGSSAIGQGEVLATPLQMATVAATVADGGRRPRPGFVLGPPAPAAGRATSATVARTMRHLMIAVVRSGTGISAAIPGVTVAGKTGTAELKSAAELKAACSNSAESGTSEPRAGEAGSEAGSEGCQGGSSEASNTDAWFAAFAPALRPRVAVCVLLVKDGAGGATAAPVARQVLEAALRGF